MVEFKRIIIILFIALGSHLSVIIIRRLGQRMMSTGVSRSVSKLRSISSLGTSIAVFVLYFGAIGLILKEVGVSLKAYLASASVLGLAIGFGSQGIVQDVVTGLTLIFSDLFDVGDMVEISGQTGIVKRIGMRFTVLENYFGAQVFLPNRTISGVVNYPKGYIRCIIDVTLSDDEEIAKQMARQIESIVSSAAEQFAGILVHAPSIEGRIKTSSGKSFLRVKYRIWPGRGAPFETTFKQEIIQSLKTIDPSYADWMVTVNFEVEKKPFSISSGTHPPR